MNNARERARGRGHESTLDFVLADELLKQRRDAGLSTNVVQRGVGRPQVGQWTSSRPFGSGRIVATLSGLGAGGPPRKALKFVR